MEIEAKKTQLLLVSGVSGAGKTTLASVCEEHGYYITEEIPIAMISSLLAAFGKNSSVYSKVALFVGLSSFEKASALVRSSPYVTPLVWGLDCSSDVLMTRYRLTRHTHPLQPKGYSLEEAIHIDATRMAKLRPLFDVYLDTSGLSERDLRIKAASLLEKRDPKLRLIISSFGYKYGLPRDAEIVIDARCLINPFWVPTLSRLTGLDKPVVDYIEKDPHTQDFMSKLFELLSDYLVHAQADGRSFVVLDVGCSGGQHRSVYVAEALAKHFSADYDCTVYHREIMRYREDRRE